MIRLLIFICPFTLFGQSSMNIELLDNWTDDNLMVNSTEIRYNDCWGFVQNGQEYAILGSTEGTHFFKISNSDKLELVDSIAGRFQASTVIHRDIKVHNGFAYAVCDEGSSSLQIIDLQYLPDSVVVVNEETDFFSRVHNVFIDTENDILYSCGGQESMGFDLFLQLWDISDPLNISMLYSSSGAIPYVHDAYVRDNIAYLNCGDIGLRVYDFSNPASPIFLQNLSIYQEQGYNHQGWMSPDGTKFLFTDETNGKKIKNCKVNADHTVTIKNYFGTNNENNSVPHNLMLSNDFAYVAYYNEGLRVYDLRGIVPIEIAHYDTYPEESLFKMEGAWGVYSELPSGRILVSDRHNGLFLFDFNEAIFSTPTDQDLLIYPNPTVDHGFTVKLNLPEIESFNIDLYDNYGKKVLNESTTGLSYITVLTNQIRAGIYHVVLSYTDNLGDIQKIRRKVVIR